MRRATAFAPALLAAFAACGLALAQAGTPTRAPAQREASPPASSDHSREVSRSALREQALQMLTEAALSTEPLIRANALEALQAAPNRAENIFRAGLQDENPGVRFVAAYSVGQLKLRSSATFIEPLLSDPDPRVRAAAIFALTALKKTVDPSPLATMLDDADPLVRGEAARILGELKNPSAIPMLKAATARADRRNATVYGASDERVYQAERVFQLQVAEALVKLGDQQSVHALRAALYPATREGFESAALAAVMLGNLNDQKASSQLVDLIEQRVPGSPESKDPRQAQYVQPREVRLAAAGALARMGFPDGLYVAEMYAGDEDPAVRAQAAYVQGEAGKKASLPALEEAMRDPSPLVRVAAAAAVLKATK
ncbi:MAG: HEAT repeat domain-containing protein [Planctomycetota bacterium]|nr:HEAT repeat domain-containing protein [Planctomycetota bacterium]